MQRYEAVLVTVEEEKLLAAVGLSPCRLCCFDKEPMCMSAKTHAFREANQDYLSCGQVPEGFSDAYIRDTESEIQSDLGVTS